MNWTANNDVDDNYISITYTDSSIGLIDYFSFDKDKYDLIIEHDKYILKEKESKDIFLPNEIPDNLFEL